MTALHLVLLWLLRDASSNVPKNHHAAPPARIALRLIAASPLAMPAVPVPSPARPSTVPAPISVPTSAPLPRREQLDAKPIAVPNRVPAPPSAPAADEEREATTTPTARAAHPTEADDPRHQAALRPEPTASAPETTGLPTSPLLDSAGTRRAIRASARQPSLTEQLAAAREEPARIDVRQRLANGVKSAGKGDCMKGQYAGAGMGLLSLPFLAAAAATGECAQ